MSELFRQQAVDAQKQKLHGDISLAQPLSIYFTVGTIVLIIIAAISFLSFSQYSRKETVRGYLVPSKGLIKAYPVATGHIEKLHVVEGQKIKKGDALATIVINRNMVNGNDLSDSLITELNAQLSVLNNESLTNIALLENDRIRLNKNISNLSNRLIVITETQSLLEEKLELKNKQHAQHEKLHKKGYLSTMEFQAQQESYINTKQELSNMKSSELQVRSELNRVKAELSQLDNQHELKIADTKRRRSDINRQLNEAKTNRRYVIRASESGTITAIQAVQGELVSNSRALMSLLPADSKLIAELLLPTRSAGFIQRGDEVRMRFDAFPYQRFGFVKGEVESIDKALLAGDAVGVPMQLNEPVYRVRSELTAQEVEAYGDNFPLKSGMLLEADIVLDSRSLLEWLLDPIYSLNGRVS
ncbi:HlyD family efflux transporter periplasmic adaptor subunit [Shewanella sp. 202IG2-18]|uniref:HlyD family secretion protein n=1 Tax=Parashewanella hymeniacidonis TaxID=2807618 RepID=UPI00196089E9|nr:efflux RND transporter periplasmic adaptor subunit [Parashewanella hymeniacidonis]MBM7073183.1 HlyD family efflux transporter periplasmic adaptor subunit [Parashewanella hymeniacidonis]